MSSCSKTATAESQFVAEVLIQFSSVPYYLCAKSTATGLYNNNNLYFLKA
jgi:hypothetical protein